MFLTGLTSSGENQPQLSILWKMMNSENESIPQWSSTNLCGTIQLFTRRFISRRSTALFLESASEFSSFDINDDGYIRNFHSCSQHVPDTRLSSTSFNAILRYCHFPFSLVPRPFVYIIQRFIPIGLNSTSWRGSSMLSHSIYELGPQNERCIAFLRWQYERSSLYLLRLADYSSQGTITLAFLPAVSGVNIQQATQQEQDTPSSQAQSLLFYVASTVDYYRDMRLDIDRMSYEELLALEDLIGNVNTGLSEETLIRSLKHTKYFLFVKENAEKDPCSICQEEYVEDDILGTLNCGHYFHTECIQQWLRCKNLCPVCKSTGLYTSTNEPCDFMVYNMID